MGTKATYGTTYTPPARWGWVQFPEFGENWLPPMVSLRFWSMERAGNVARARVQSSLLP